MPKQREGFLTFPSPVPHFRHLDTDPERKTVPQAEEMRQASLPLETQQLPH